MVHPADSVWRRSELWHWLAKATVFTLIPAMTLGIAAVLFSSQPKHQTVNRAAKSDAMVSLATLKAKRSLQVSWDQFFDVRQRAEPRPDVRLVAESSSKQKMLAGRTLKARFVTDFE
jgi:hypothetical protein